MFAGIGNNVFHLFRCERNIIDLDERFTKRCLILINIVGFQMVTLKSTTKLTEWNIMERLLY